MTTLNQNTWSSWIWTVSKLKVILNLHQIPASHLYIYRHRPDVYGVVHTHSAYATAFAAVNKPIPVVLTAIADEFGGPIPCGGFALDRR